MDTTYSVAESVQRGAALLDQYKPDWYTKVDISQLEILSTDKCILGQVYGDFIDGKHTLDIFGSSVCYGFSPYLWTAYETTAAWRDLITQRRLETITPAPNKELSEVDRVASN